MYVHICLWYMQHVEMPKLTWKGCCKTVMNKLHIEPFPAALRLFCANLELS